MNFKKRVNGSWTDTPNYIHKTDTDTITTLPAVLYPTGATATVGLKGQTTQSSIPSPTSPVMPQETGERTGNLLDFNQLKNAPSGTIGSITFSHVLTLQLKPNTYYTMASNGTGSTSSTPADLYRSVYFNATTGESSVNKNNPVTVLTDSTGVVGIGFFSERTNAQQYLSGEAQLWINEGSEPIPYEPYGYKIPISSANTTTPVYLGEVETTRNIKKLVFDGTENFNNFYGQSLFGAQTLLNRAPFIVGTSAYSTHFKYNPVQSGLNSAMSNGEFALQRVEDTVPAFNVFFKNTTFTSTADFKAWLSQQYANGTPVTVWYVLATPETAVVNEPLRKIGEYADEVSGITIPVTAGGDILSVGTTVQPSEVTVNYKGWHPVADVHERENGAWT